MNFFMQNEKRCYFCGARYALHRHHIYEGTSRHISEKYGFTVYLCARHHTGAMGVHRYADLDRMLKQSCQRKFEQTHSRQAFCAIIGKNYLEEEEKT